MKHPVRVLVVLALFALVAAAAFIRLPYYAEGPGPAREVQPMIDVGSQPRYDSPGRLIMTTVSWYPLTAMQALRAWLDPHLKVVSEDVLYPPGQDRMVEEQRSRSQMDTSKVVAAMVALGELEDYPREHGRGALVGATEPGCPAFDRLFSGDVITAVGDRQVATQRQAARAMEGVPDEDPVRFTVRGGGETHRVAITRAVCMADDEEPLLGVTIVPAFPFPVEISSGDVGGPSAGLMFALGLYDVLTPGDLTGGRTVAGTGELLPDGTVRGISGIADKAEAAARVGASVFLVPESNIAELRASGTDLGDMRFVPVSSFGEALDALEAPDRPGGSMR